MNLNNYPWAKVIEHALFVGIGAAVTYLAAYLSGINFGGFTPVVVAVFAIITAFVANLITNTDPGPTTTTNDPMWTPKGQWTPAKAEDPVDPAPAKTEDTVDPAPAKTKYPWK